MLGVRKQSIYGHWKQARLGKDWGCYFLVSTNEYEYISLGYKIQTNLSIYDPMPEFHENAILILTISKPCFE